MEGTAPDNYILHMKRALFIVNPATDKYAIKKALFIVNPATDKYAIKKEHYL